MTSTTTKLGNKKKADRVYNSYHNCTYCDKLCSNFAQHMKRRHLKEADVEKIYAISDEKKRRRQIALLSAEMDHVHNMKVKKMKGEKFCCTEDLQAIFSSTHLDLALHAFYGYLKKCCEDTRKSVSGTMKRN